MDGYFVTHELNLGKTPSPWLRLAHRQVYPPENNGLRANERHIRDHEWIYQEKGHSWCVLPELGGMILVPEGSVILIPPDLHHAYCHPAGSHLAVHFDLTPRPELEIDQMLRYHGIAHRQSPQLIQACIQFRDGDHVREVPMVQQPQDSQGWIENMKQLIHLWTTGRHRQAGQRLRTSSILSEMLHDFAYGDHVHSASISQEERIWNSLSNSDLSDRTIRVAELATSSGMGETAYRAAVKKLTGLTPRAWLEQRRCEKAIIMLQSGEHDVQSVAISCGYEDPYHFSRVMKRVYGKAPSAFLRSGQLSRPS